MDLIRYLRRQIRCENGLLPQILREAAVENPLPILRAIDLAEPFDLSRAYRNAKECCSAEMFFSRGEWNETDRLFCELGQGDRETQGRQLELREAAFAELLREAESRLRKNGRLALVLGGCSGAMLVLMLT